MKDIFITPSDIKKDIKEIEQLGAQVSQRLNLMAQNIKYIFSKIKLCENIESAENYFEILDDIQSMLSILVYKYDMGIPDRLWRFMSDFDNFEEAKKYYFPQIKSGEYSF
ncbi:MAG TPA: hypothetical protein PLU71_00770 [Candidatus Dependentiae bacterium]|nr:hypothetical protein [Candidatus Dependentiae bacterium]HRQ62366.1 hypothetical protein [Candidatus Dependentiae bacterium]